MTKIRDELLTELLAGYEKPDDLLGPDGLLKRLTGALVEKALAAELTHHLGYAKHAVEGRGSGNSRNGASKKTLKTDHGPVTIDVPRDRSGTFEPQCGGSKTHGGRAREPAPWPKLPRQGLSAPPPAHEPRRPAFPCSQKVACFASAPSELTDQSHACHSRRRQK